MRIRCQFEGHHLAVHASGAGPAHSCPERNWDVDIETSFPELEVINTDGEGANFPDVFPGDQFQGEVLITNNSDDVIRDVWAGYWFEHPWVQGLDATIYSDHPEYDQQTWEVNDADDAPENPASGEYGQEGHLNLYAFSPGESKRIVFEMEASEYSIGVVDHPDLRTWIHSIEDIYGTQDGFWDDPDEINLVEENLRAFTELDVLSRDHWHFAASDKQQLEGWRRCSGSSDGMSVDTDAESLSVLSEGGVCLRSPEWTQIDADTYDQLVIDVDGGEIPDRWSIHWSGDQSGSQLFGVDGADGDGFIAFPVGDGPAWGGVVEELQVEADSGELDLGALFFQSSQGEVSTPRAEFVSENVATTLDEGDGDGGHSEDAGIPGQPGEGDGGDVSAGSGDTNGTHNGGSHDDSMSTSSCSSVSHGPVSLMWWLSVVFAVATIRGVPSITGR